MSFHTELGIGDIHQIYDQVYADDTARDADTTWNGNSANIGKTVFVSGTGLLYMLLSTTPSWVGFGTGVVPSIYSGDGTILGNRNVDIGGFDLGFTNGQVGIGTTTPDASAIFQVDSTTQGLLPPRMTTTERNLIATPATGLEIYNTTTNQKEHYNGSAWISLEGDNIYTADGTITEVRAVSITGNNIFAIDNYNLLPSTYTLRTGILMEDNYMRIAHATGNGIGDDVDQSWIEIGSTGMEVKDEVSDKGLFYNADYSVNYTDRSLIDKKYSDDGSFYRSNGVLTSSRTVFFESGNVVTITGFDTNSSTYTERGSLFVENDFVALENFKGNGLGGDTTGRSFKVDNTNINITDDDSTTQDVFNITCNTVTTGVLQRLYTNASGTQVRDLFAVINDNAAATNTVNLYARNDSTGLVSRLQGAGTRQLDLLTDNASNFGGLTITENTNDDYWDIYSEFSGNGLDADLHIHYTNSSSQTTEFMEFQVIDEDTGNIVLGSTGDFILAKYGNDYSAIYDDRTLIDRGYATNTFSQLGTSVTEFFTASDLPAPSGGVITLTSGLYTLKDNLTLSDRFSISAPAQFVTINSEDFGQALTYSGSSSTFITSANQLQIGLVDVQIICSGTSAQLLDIDDGATVFIDNLRTSWSGAAGTIGTILEAPVAIKASTFTGFVNGLTFDNCPGFLVSELRIQSAGTGSDALIRVEGAGVVSGTFDGITGFTGASEALFYIDPAHRGVINISNCVDNGTGNYFLAGTTGSFTAVTDSSLSGSVTSVADVGGVAEFTDTAHGLTVGETVTQTGFTETTYNGTFVVSAVPTANTYQLADVAYVSTDTGNWSADTITITSTAHGLPNGETLSIFGTASYDDGYTIFNVQTNTFDVSLNYSGRSFVATESGTWDTGSLTEKSPFVTLTGDSGDQKPSFNIGSMVANNNATTTTITTINTWTDLNLGGNASLGSNAELWTLNSPTTGELTYNGNSEFFGSLIASISSVSVGGAQEFQFRAVKNGSPLTDGVISAREMGADTGNLSLVVPITAVNGDDIRVQVQNIDGTSNVTIKHISVEIK